MEICGCHVQCRWWLGFRQRKANGEKRARLYGWKS
jgi:hypothetical protein